MLFVLLLYYIKFLINSNQYNCISRNSVINHYQIKSILTLCLSTKLERKRPKMMTMMVSITIHTGTDRIPGSFRGNGFQALLYFTVCGTCMFATGDRKSNLIWLLHMNFIFTMIINPCFSREFLPAPHMPYRTYPPVEDTNAA